MKPISLFILLAFVCGFKTERLSPVKHYNIKLAEPSDVCLSTLTPSHFFIVSNRGSIAETDENGKILRKTKYDGSDYEAICMVDSQLFVINESLRRLEARSATDFSLKRSLYLSYNGPRNAGFESLAYLRDQKKFIAVTEDPVIIYELNEQFQMLNQISFKQFSEISSVTYHQGSLWFLSDEMHEVMKVNPVSYDIEARWKLPLINPEGICFDETGDMMILSDDMEMLFRFKTPM